MRRGTHRPSVECRARCSAQGWEHCIPRAAHTGNAFAIGGIFGEIPRRSHEENTDCPRVVVLLALLVAAQNRGHSRRLSPLNRLSTAECFRLGGSPMPRHNSFFALLIVAFLSTLVIGCGGGGKNELRISGTLPSSGTVNASYGSATLSASGGSGGYTWTTSGLPNGGARRS